MKIVDYAIAAGKSISGIAATDDIVKEVKKYIDRNEGWKPSGSMITSGDTVLLQPMVREVTK